MSRRRRKKQVVWPWVALVTMVVLFAVSIERFNCTLNTSTSWSWHRDDFKFPRLLGALNVLVHPANWF